MGPTGPMAQFLGMSPGWVLDGQPSPALGGLRPWEAGPNEALTYIGQGNPASPTKSQRITSMWRWMSCLLDAWNVILFISGMWKLGCILETTFTQCILNLWSDFSAGGRLQVTCLMCVIHRYTTVIPLYCVRGCGTCGRLHRSTTQHTKWICDWAGHRGVHFLTSSPCWKSAEKSV